MYNAQPRIDLPSEVDKDKTRSFLNKLDALTGPKVMRALFRRAAVSIPWRETLNISQLMPLHVPIPQLSQLTEERVYRLLKKVPTFLHIGDEIEKVVNKTRLAVFDAGNTLIHQGEKEGFLFVIVQGRLAVEHDHSFGHTVLAVLSEGGFVGEIGFLSGGERTASVRALDTALTLCIHRDDIGPDMPLMQKAVQEAESGRSWLQLLSKAQVIREFPLPLRARVGLESQHIHLDRGQTLPLESDPVKRDILVILSGQPSLIDKGQVHSLKEGGIIGLEETLENRMLSGVIRAETPCHAILIERRLFLDTLIELLTPKQILKAAECQYPKSAS